MRSENTKNLEMTRETFRMYREVENLSGVLVLNLLFLMKVLVVYKFCHFR